MGVRPGKSLLPKPYLQSFYCEKVDKMRLLLLFYYRVFSVIDISGNALYREISNTSEFAEDKRNATEPAV